MKHYTLGYAYLTRYVFVLSTETTRCEVVEGMEDPQFIPDDMIDVDGGKMPDSPGNLRPNSARPFRVNQNRITVRFTFRPSVPVESVRLPTSTNVKTFTVKYVRPSRPNDDVPVADVSFEIKTQVYY